MTSLEIQTTNYGKGKWPPWEAQTKVRVAEENAIAYAHTSAWGADEDEAKANLLAVLALLRDKLTEAIAGGG